MGAKHIRWHIFGKNETATEVNTRKPRECILSTAFISAVAVWLPMEVHSMSIKKKKKKKETATTL